MPRNEVNDNPNLACQAGFHVANFSFAWSYGSGGHMIMVSVDPQMVVSMPNAYEFTKMRVCEYTILSEVTKEQKGNLYKAMQDDKVDSSSKYDYDNGSEDSYDDEEECEDCDGEGCIYCE